MEVHGRSRALQLGIAIVLVAASLALFATAPGRVSAVTVVCGDIASATWTAAGSPYYVTCNGNVPIGATLTIQKGVNVFMSPGTGFGVQGVLVVSGGANAPVVFDSNASTPAPGDWYGIYASSSAHTQITGLVVRHATIGLLSFASSPSGQGFTVQSSEFAFNSNVGIMSGSSPGISPPYLQDVFVHDNGGGITANGTLNVADSTIQANGNAGIYATYGISVTNSTVSDNVRYGIYVFAPPRAPPYPPSVLACNGIARNGVGVDIESGIDPNPANIATVYRNNFLNNTVQAVDHTASAWDDSTTGNFWSDYTGTDGNGDGFGDTPYVIDADTQDRFPFMALVAGCPGGGPQPIDHPPGAATARDAQLTGNQFRDVALSWDPSADDGTGENDVTAYLLYTSTTFDRAGTGYMLLATLPLGTTTYTDAGAGARDPSNHFYRLVVRDAAGQTTASPDQFEKYTRALAAGPQLLSIPVHMSDTRIDTVLRGLDYTVARAYVNPAGQGKNWLTKARDKPWGDLTAIDERMALWLFVDRDSTLAVAGLVRASLTVPLAVGWNFVGYPSFVDRTVGEALAGAKLQTVEGFDTANPPYYLSRLGVAGMLRAGDGLWVHVSEPFDWTLTN